MAVLQAIFTHLSARVPGDDEHFLINPYGLLYDEMCASNMVKVDLNGDKVMDSPFDINPAGFVVHSAVHEVLSLPTGSKPVTLSS